MLLGWTDSRALRGTKGGGALFASKSNYKDASGQNEAGHRLALQGNMDHQFCTLAKKPSRRRWKRCFDLRKVVLVVEELTLPTWATVLLRSRP